MQQFQQVEPWSKRCNKGQPSMTSQSAGQMRRALDITCSPFNVVLLSRPVVEMCSGGMVWWGVIRAVDQAKSLNLFAWIPWFLTPGPSEFLVSDNSQDWASNWASQLRLLFAMHTSYSSTEAFCAAHGLVIIGSRTAMSVCLRRSLFYCDNSPQLFPFSRAFSCVAEWRENRRLLSLFHELA